MASAAAAQVWCVSGGLVPAVCSAWRSSLWRGALRLPRAEAGAAKKGRARGTRVWGTGVRGFLWCTAAGAGWRSQCTAPAALLRCEPTLNGAFDPCAGSGCEWMQGRRHPPRRMCGPRAVRAARLSGVHVSLWRSCAAQGGPRAAARLCVGMAWVSRRRNARRARAGCGPPVPPRPRHERGETRCVCVCVCAPHSPAQAVGCGCSL